MTQNNLATPNGRTITRAVLDIVLYVVVFFLLQYIFQVITGAIGMWLKGDGANMLSGIKTGNLGMTTEMIVVASVLASMSTICIFAKVKWAPVSRNWLKTHPWGVLFWAVCLSLGTILPSEWLLEQLQVSLPSGTEKLFEQIMGKPWGYLAIGIFAPLAEELVFRGAILRKLLTLTGERWHWLAIALSAVVFGAVHGNVPQFIHAALIGLLLGWMYYRTGSILPGVMFHWVNNTVAYVMFNLMPQMGDGKLIDLFQGDHRMMVLGIIFSLFILVPSILQLNWRMKR